MPRVVIAPAFARWLTVSPTTGAKEVVVGVAGATVRDCLNHLFEKYPTLRGYVLDETETLRHHVVAFIAGDSWTTISTTLPPIHAVRYT